MHPFRCISVIAVAAALAACGRAPDAARYAGMVLTAPIEKPDLVFTATDGRPYDLRAQTAGSVTLLFFGYASCPDICPLHLANLGAAMRTLPARVRSQITVVFVTTDPERDSLPVMRRWLDAFDSTFVGLRAPLSEVNLALAALRLPGARIDTLPDGTTGVAHPAAIVAFTRDNFVRVAYPSGVTQSDWVRDLPHLVKDEGTGFAATHPRVPRALVVAPAGNAPAALYATFYNPGDAPDTLRGCVTQLAADCTLHEQRASGGRRTMQPRERIVVAPGDTTRLAPGGLHAMLEPPLGRLVPGDSVGVTFYLKHAGAVAARARVVSYAELDGALAEPLR